VKTTLSVMLVVRDSTFRVPLVLLALTTAPLAMPVIIVQHVHLGFTTSQATCVKAAFKPTDFVSIVILRNVSPASLGTF
jgi:hypothetical protein